MLICCEEPPQRSNSLSIELGSCWGAIEDDSSCSHLVLSELPLTRVGCWALSRGERTYRMLMSWNGQQLTPANEEQVTPLPFSVGDDVTMHLFLFDRPISTSQCESLDLNVSCAETSGCRARLERSEVRLRLNMWLGFRDGDGQCQAEVMSDDPEGRCLESSLACGLASSDTEECELTAGSLAGDSAGSSAGAIAGNLGGELNDSCIPEAERCDLVDNDCDSIIDEATEQGEPCVRSFIGCAGEFPGRYECSTSGAECVVSELPSLDDEETCDGLDNDCDGVIDNVITLGERCELEVTPECSREGRLICDAPVTSGITQPLTCQIPLEGDSSDHMGERRREEGGELCDGLDNDCDGEIDEGFAGLLERCDGRDDDCDGLIDEGQTCGRLIAQRCAVSLGWARIEEDSSVLPFVWDQIPPPIAEPTCGMYDQRDEPMYSCDTATLGQGFRVINLPGYLSTQDWLGVAWTCDAQEHLEDPNPPSAVELETLAWAREHCGVALAYSDYDWYGSRISTLIPELCPTFAPYNDISFIPRCVLTREPSRYVALELEGAVNSDDQLGIAFLCSPEGDEREREIARKIESQFQIILGVHQGSPRAQDGMLTWGDLPLQDNLTDLEYRGVRSADRGRFSTFTFIGRGLQIQELSVKTQVR